MIYSNLTKEQQNEIDDFTNFIRPLAGEVAKVFNHISAALASYHAGVQDILTDLDDAEILPNRSGLAGSGQITKADLASFIANLVAAKTNFDTETNHQQWALLAGTQNLIG